MVTWYGRMGGVEWQALDPMHRPVFERAFSSLDEPLSEHSFASICVLKPLYDLHWTVIQEHICLFGHAAGKAFLFMPPLALDGPCGTKFVAAFLGCVELLSCLGDEGDFEFEYFNGAQRAMIEPLMNRLPIDVRAMYPDYVYETTKLATLAGNAYKSKRHAKSRFVRDVPNHRLETYAPRHLEGCLALLDRWCAQGMTDAAEQWTASNVSTRELRSRDRAASIYAMSHADALGLEGLVVQKDEQIIAFTLGAALNTRQFFVLLEKTDIDYAGAAQFIYAEFCQQLLGRFEEINAGDDWGIPTLRFTKQSYRPVRLLPKYSLRLAKEP